MEAGECLRFDFSILLTPLKELDTGKRFAARYDQSWDAVDCVEEANRAGANYINIHHANHANPYINYPFIEKDRLRALSDEIHAAGLKMKLYYTVREFSDYAYEMQPFLSLGDEIYPRPREGMESILWQPDTLKSFQQKYGETVIPAWKSDVDSALLTDGSSRLCNYYIEGLDYLAKEVDIDGIYLDDVAFDRVTMRRARRVLDLKEDCLIDLHSWNHYCEEAGWGNSLNIYMPLLPYIDSIWIGEGFDHQGEDEAFWIVEIAGLPFGMSGEILSEVQESQYRGMLFGITHRFMGLKVEPRYLWKFIDEYGIGHMELTGFWNEACPVKASDDRVKVSLYMDRASGKGAIAYASFAQEETTFVIEDGIGMQAMRMPPIKLFQEGRELAGGECIAVVPGGGGIIVFECKRNLLIVSDEQCDFTDVLESCGIRTTRIPFSEAVYMDLSGFDAFCILAARSGDVLEPRFRERLEAECAKGKRVFLQAVRSFQDNGCQGPVGTTRSRLIYVEPQDGEGIEGLDTGDLLDDEANLMCTPEYNLADMEPLLVYKEQIIAHTHTDMDRVEILKNCRYGMWRCGDNVLATAFVLRNFNKARFAPRRVWQVLISYIARWLTGNSPAFWPESVVQYGTKEDISVPEIFEKCRREAIERGITWMNGFLIDQGRGGIMEGTRHDIDPDGNQSILTGVRTDCVGECSGAYKMYAYLYGKKEYARLGEAMDDLVYGPMVVHGGACDGMMRWCTSGWGVCYQDDVARAILPGLYDSLFMKNDRRMAEICNVLDFLVRTTARDGLRVWRTDKYELTEQAMEALPEEEHGMASAHYNAYYLAALLLAARATGENRYLEMARRGLTSLMARYPDTVREQSETEEMCRLILPLAVLYKATGEEEHREMLYRVARDLQKVRHPFGGYMEWDSGYKAACSRESTGECSLLTENGDPIADLLYSSNWLPIGFAFAYDATGDQWFHTLWHDSVAFCLRTQIISENPLTNGSWCRAFDMEMQEAYAAPHDVGWACYGSESGWTNAEILMGIMMPEILSGSKKG